MQLLIDFGPVIAFVVAYWLTDFKTAVLVIMAAVVVQVAATWLRSRTVSKMAIVSAALVLAFGGISLVLNNELIFKWKPTVLYWAMAIAFAISAFVGRKTLAQRMLEAVPNEEFKLAAADWTRLNLMWVVYFAISGLANIFVAYTFDEATWVNFKLFGLMGLTLVFVVVQSMWIANRAEAEETEQDNGET
jgi:intracellular septation protein